MLLARMRTYPLTPPTTPRVLGIDDFAFRRGRRYGTIVVDLERHRPVDLLPERSAQVVAAWLTAHPGVEIISRDRGGDYAAGAREGAPDAVQIADRFHLIKNLGEVVERVVRRHAHVVEQQTATTPLAHSVATAPPRSETQQTHDQVNDSIRRRYEAIHARAARGMSGEQIARELGLHRHTVERNLRLPHCPKRARHPRRPTMLDPYESYLSQRWAEGCHTARRLWREIVAQGFPGSYQPVSRFAAYLRQQEHLASDALAAGTSSPQPHRTAGADGAGGGRPVTPQARYPHLRRTAHPDQDLSGACRTRSHRRAAGRLQAGVSGAQSGCSGHLAGRGRTQWRAGTA